MSFASGARHELAFVPETTPGTTPASPSMTRLRHTGCTINLTRDTLESKELRHDRMVADARTGTDKVGGNIEFELSYGEYDAFLAAALAGTWDNNKLKVGGVEQAFTIERGFGNIGQYGIYRGCYVNQLSLSVKPSAMITGSLGIVGMNVDYVSTPLSASPTASQTARPYDSYTGTLSINGAEVAIVTGLDMSLDNGITPQFPILNKSALFVDFNRSRLTGTMTAFFQDRAMLDLFIKETPSSLSLTIGDGVSKSYTFTVPRLIYTGADNPASGEGPITLSMPWSAILDPAEGTSFIITRIPGDAVVTALSIPPSSSEYE